MKVTAKGQVTVPLAMRERYGLQPGVEIEFLSQGDCLQIKPRRRIQKSGSAADQWLARAAGSAAQGITTDQIMAMTRGDD